MHVLSTPPAFILSQDQTLQFETCDAIAPEGLITLLNMSMALNGDDEAEELNDDDDDDDDANAIAGVTA